MERVMNNFLFYKGISNQQRTNVWEDFRTAFRSWGTSGKTFEVIFREPVNKGAFRGYWVLIGKARDWMNDQGNNYTKEQISEYFKRENNFVENIEGVETTRSLKRNDGCTHDELISLINSITRWGAQHDIKGLHLTSEAELELQKYYESKHG